jgi:hypothetical protein
MTSTRPSNAARFGLLIAALVHLLATAALPFTHAHAPPESGREVLAGPPGADPGPERGHPDLCTACRTLTSVQAGPAAATAGAAPAESIVVDRPYDGTAGDPHRFTLSQPRAPPVA